MKFTVCIIVLVVFLVGASAKPSIRAPQPDTDNVTMETSGTVGGCRIVQGPPGRDGRDGLPGSPGTCSLSFADSRDLKKDIEGDLSDIIEAAIRNFTEEKMRSIAQPCTGLGSTSDQATKSCGEIYKCNSETTNGLYWLTTGDEESVRIYQVYCDMEAWHCGVKGGWMRVAYISMSQPGAECPSPFRLVTSPKRLCGRASIATGGCSSKTFSTHGISYNKVCGQVKGYQYASHDGFAGSIDIDSYYVDGISITHGSPRKHLWTYAVGLSDDVDHSGYNNCPCAKFPGPSPPSFVGNHYYCESGNTGPYEYHFYDEPLWDGEGCGAGNNCCAQSGMPWFCRAFPQEVDDDIEVRNCANEGTDNEDTYIDILEIYVM